MTDFKGNMIKKEVKETDDSKDIKRVESKDDGQIGDKATE